MSRALRALLCLALAMVFAVPATAADAGCTDPTTGALVLTQQQTYIRQAQTKAGNLGAVGATDFPTWSETAPAQSVQQGAGGGYAAPYGAAFAEDHYDKAGLTLEGTFNGCLDTMLFELYAFLPTNRTGTSGSGAESPFNGVVQLDVDGKQISIPSDVEMATTPNPKGSATYRLRFAYTGIHLAMTRAGLDPAAEHQVRFNVVPRYLNTSNALFVYDTTEVPAGILFNGAPDATYAAVVAG